MGLMGMKLSEVESRNREVFSHRESLEQYSRLWLFPAERRILERYWSRAGSVLDMGCGCGRTSHFLKEMGHRVTAIDIVPEMLEIARNLVPGVDFRWMDACDLEFGRASFDYVLFSYNGIDCIHPEEKRMACLREIHRVLRPGGILVFSTHNAMSVKDLFPTNRFRLRNLLLNLRKGRLLQPYRLEAHPSGVLELYATTLYRQRRDLRAMGFRTLKVYGQDGSENAVRICLFDLWIYYVCAAIPL
jgi:SAM-dependent methyltransferase